MRVWIQTAVVLAACQVAAPATQANAEKWIEFAANTDRSQIIFVDVDSIRPDGKLVRYSGKIVFSPPAYLLETGQVAESFVSATVDCGEKTVAVADSFLKDSHGKVVKSEKSDTLVFRKPRQASAGEKVIERLCTAVARGGGFEEASGTAQKPGVSLSPSGSGFAINAEGWVLTAQQVVQGCSSVSVFDAAKSLRHATVVASDPAAGLALLKCDRGFTAAARFREGSGARVGESVTALGFPLPGVQAGEAGVFSGTVSALSGLRNNSSQLQISAPVQAGNSGGPVLDTSGNVIGVVVPWFDAIKFAGVAADIPQDANFAIKGEFAQIFLQAQGTEFQAAPSGASLPKDEIADRARAFTVRVECTPAAPAE
jgi:S1-C subfamily serine protease